MVTFVNEDIRAAARKLAEDIEEELGATIHAAALNYESDLGRWRFVIMSSAIARRGSTAVFGAVQKALAKRQHPFELDDVSIAIPGVNDAIVQMSKLVAVPREPTIEPPPEFVSCAFNGQEISHSWLLWSVPAVAVSSKKSA